ncbi:hypothetical protein GON26_19495 [Flavobacterium sp. GA093]|uniref:Uncharacterized protein n=1 Tax=Flavobacterium hydrocarbonoxydans TaxID=2683249 RepID=A0A6I4NVS1_9FLAO|nr:class I lanthipeptide [Flavobacterium hydrocarbonoxydans]MWB96555.1 hypothetical protein [Flavobacterium hydrocarbonoxydans]
MKKITIKKLVLKKTNIVELNSDQARQIVGGGDEVSGAINDTVAAVANHTNPRSMYSMFCPA